MTDKRELFLERYEKMGHKLTGNETTKQVIRINTLKTSDQEVYETLSGLGVKLRKIGYLQRGYVVEYSPFSVGASIEYLLGLFSIQESASQLPVQVMKPSPGETVWDMCAAPGGKTTQMAEYMKNQGLIIAYDIDRQRIYSLENHLERCGVENCLVYLRDSSSSKLEYSFSKVLLDAPCSGNYVTDPEWFQKRSLKDVLGNAEAQRKLLSNALSYLVEGGTLVYSTCSLEPEENELNIQWLLDNYKVSLDAIEGPGERGLTTFDGMELDNSIAKCMRFWPDDSETQGFFIAKVIKT